MQGSVLPRTRPPRAFWSARLATLSLALGIAACGSTDDSSSLSGTAATGAPIVNGSVSVVCKSGPELSATTSATGTWSVTLSTQTLPCKVRVTGGQIDGVPNTEDYHSVAAELGTVNITPLTDLAVARLAQEDPATWFGKRGAEAFSTIDASKVAEAVSAVVESLGLATYLGGDNPLKTAFTAKVQATDRIDLALEALKQAGAHGTIRAAAIGQDFAAAAASFRTALLAALPPATPAGGGGGSTGALACTDTEMMSYSNGAVRNPTAEEVATFVKSYTGSVWSGTTETAGTASLAADGTLTMNGKTYQATGLCYDTTIGLIEYGNTLYVYFSGGKADLWAKNGKYSGSLDSGASQPSGGASLYVSVMGSGTTSPFRLEGVSKPASSTEFCNAVGGTGALALNSSMLGGYGSYQVTNCSLSGSIGTIRATVTLAGGAAISYDVYYEFD
jgi:hypothetical protein